MNNGISIEMRLAAAFAEVYDLSFAWYPKREVVQSAACCCEKEPDIETARQNLGIETVVINGLPYWRWASAEEPSVVWEEKSMEMRQEELQ